MSGLEGIARASGGPAAVERVRANRQESDTYSFHGFGGDDARLVFSIFDGVD